MGDLLPVILGARSVRSSILVTAGALAWLARPAIAAIEIAPPGAASDAGAEADAGASDGFTADAGWPADAGAAAVGAPPPQGPLLLPAPRVIELRGAVLARGTREPIVGAALTVDSIPVGETDRTGTFVLLLAPGRRRLQVQAPGHEPLEVTLDLVARRAPAPLVLRLAPRQSGERYETVVVAADEQAPRTSLRDDELTRIPGTFGDPLRVIESLPGVTQVVWPVPVYAVRGANPGNTGFFVDGVRLPQLFHLALGPSVIHPFFLEQIDFYPGGYPARHGRFVSGVVAARTAIPRVERTHVSADLRLFDASGIVVIPIAAGRGSVAVAGRYSYVAALYSRLADDYELGYWDYQVRVDHVLGPGRATVFAFGSGDRVLDKTRPGAGGGPSDADISFHRLDLRWDGRVLDGRLRLGVALGRDASATAIDQLVAAPISVSSLSVAPRGALTKVLSDAVELEVGADAELQRLRPQAVLASAVDNDLFRERGVAQAGAFAALTFVAGQRLSVSPGVRVDVFAEQDVTEVEPQPRLTLRWRLDGDVWLKATAGRFAQLASMPAAVPGFENFGLATFGPQISHQGSLGAEVALPRSLSLDVTGFFQRLRVTDLQSQFNYDPQRKTLLELRDGQGYGVEILLRRAQSRRLHGWLAYTLSRSVRVVGDYNARAPSDWDQRHVLNLVTAYRFDRGYSLGGRVHYNTGRPYPVFDTRAFTVEYQRLPSFFQIDARADKRFVFDRFVLDAYVELVNATLSRQVVDRSINIEGQTIDRGFAIVIPSIGVHAEW